MIKCLSKRKWLLTLTHKILGFLLQTTIHTIQYKIYTLYYIIFEQQSFIPQFCTVFNPIWLFCKFNMYRCLPHKTSVLLKILKFVPDKTLSKTYSSTDVECNNCGYIDQGVYCSNCGGHLKKQRISMSHLLSSIVDFFSNFEDKYVHTFVSLTTRPINFISHYLHASEINITSLSNTSSSIWVSIFLFTPTLIFRQSMKMASRQKLRSFCSWKVRPYLMLSLIIMAAFFLWWSYHCMYWPPQCCSERVHIIWQKEPQPSLFYLVIWWYYKLSWI